jgi:Fic family protein
LHNQDVLDQFVLKLTYHSNSIEGSTLTEPDTAAILFHNVALSHKSLNEQLEAKNHQTALLFLLDYISKDLKIDEKLVLKLHGILMNGIRPDAGLYRNHGVRIAGTDIPTANYMSIPNLISDVFSEIYKKTNDFISLSTCVHAKFERIHPFSDGNGRIGRLLMTAMLLQKNFPPAIIRQERKQLYYAYLYKAQTKDDQSQLEGYICDAIFDGFKILERKDIK